MVCLVVVVGLGAAACTNPDGSSAVGPERGDGGGDVESAGAGEVVRGGGEAGEDAAAVADVAGGSGAPGGDRVEAPVGVEHDDPSEDPARADVVPVFVELAGLVEAVAEAGRLSGLLSVGPSVWCGLRADGSVACLRSHDGELPEGGSFVAITNGVGFRCGLGPDGTVECWGHGYEVGETVVPGGVFTAVSSGGHRSCGLRPGGGLACWARRREFWEYPSGDWSFLDVPLPEEFLAWATEHPGGVFGAVSVGHGHVCGLRADGVGGVLGRGLVRPVVAGAGGRVRGCRCGGESLVRVAP